MRVFGAADDPAIRGDRARPEIDDGRRDREPVLVVIGIEVRQAGETLVGLPFHPRWCESLGRAQQGAIGRAGPQASGDGEDSHAASLTAMGMALPGNRRPASPTSGGPPGRYASPPPAR